jgi:hypothetical protein
VQDILFCCISYWMIGDLLSTLDSSSKGIDFAEPLGRMESGEKQRGNGLHIQYTAL